MTNLTSLPLRANRRPVAPAPAPAAPSAPSAPVWNSIDPATLPEDLAALYFAYRQAADLATKARQLFESECNEAFDVGATNRLAFGYKFGKLSAAIVPKAAPASRSALSLSSLGKLR